MMFNCTFIFCCLIVSSAVRFARSAALLLLKSEMVLDNCFVEGQTLC